MSRSTTLTCQSVNVDLVIRKNKKISLDKIKAYCEHYCSKYAFIEHEHDITPEGVVEGVHYHLVLKYSASKVAFSTRLNEICNFFGFENANGIQIDKLISLTKALQYLIHKNNKEKTPHNITDIVHNYEQSDFDILMNSELEQVITFDLLYSIIIHSNNIIEVIKELGIGNYRTWRNVVWDIWNELHKS